MRSRWGRITKLGLGLLGVGGAAGSAVAFSAAMWTMQDSDDPEPFRRRVAYNPVGENAWLSVFQGSPQWDKNWDRRDPASYMKPKNTVTDSNNNVDPGADSGSSRNDIEKMTPHASRHIFLIRHGHYNINGEADHERGLTELGREQASLTGVRLRALNLPYKLLVRSTMKRALETAELLMKELQAGNDLEVRESDLLREGAPIPPEPPVGHWRPEKHQFFEDGARIEAAFRKYFHRAEPTQEGDSYEILVCHANVIRYFVCRALQFPPEGWLRMNLHHGSVTWITIRPSGRVVLQSLGDAGHIPPDKLSSSSGSKKRKRKNEKAREKQQKSALTKFFDWKAPVEVSGNSEA